MLVVLAIGIAIVVLVAGVVLLRVACKLCRVEPPDVGDAVRITIYSELADGFWALGMNWILGVTGVELSPFVTWSILIVLFMLASAGIYSAMIHASYGRAVLIWLVQFAIFLSICCALGFIAGFLVPVF